MLVSLAVNVFLNGSYDITFDIANSLLGGLIGWLFTGGEPIKLPFETKSRSWRSRLKHIIPIHSLRNGLLIGLGVGLSSGSQIGGGYGLNDWLREGLIGWLCFGLSSVLLSLIFEERRMTYLDTKKTTKPQRSIWLNLINVGHLRNGLLVGIFVGLGYGLNDGLIDGFRFQEIFSGADNGLSSGLSDGLEFALYFGLIGVLLSLILIGKSRSIQPSDTVVLSWRNLWWSFINIKQLRRALIVGMVVLLCFGLSLIIRAGREMGPIYSYYAWDFGLNEILKYGLSSVLSISLSVGFSYWLILGLSNGLSSTTLEGHRRVTPNEGIRHSASNSLRIGCVSALASGFVYELSQMLPYGLTWWLSNIELNDLLIIMLAGGIIAGLLTGGLACLRHAVLRWLLWRSKYISWNYSHFLDDSTQRILLKRVGGGYSFVHRLVLD